MKRFIAVLLLALMIPFSAAAEHDHIYSEFVSNGDGTHTAWCGLNDCTGHYNAPCEFIDVETPAGSWRVCPVCGQTETGDVIPWAGAVGEIGSYPGWAGRVQVRIGELPDGSVLLLVSLERAGKVAWLVQPLVVTLTLPDEGASGLRLRALAGVVDQGLACDWVDGHAVIRMILPKGRQAAVLLLSHQEE